MISSSELGIELGALPLILGCKNSTMGTGIGLAILTWYDLVADSAPLSSITVNEIVYNPGSVKLCYTVDEFSISSPIPVMFHRVCNNDVSPSGSKDKLSNKYSVSTVPSEGLANTATGL